MHRATNGALVTTAYHTLMNQTVGPQWKFDKDQFERKARVYPSRRCDLV